MRSDGLITSVIRIPSFSTAFARTSRRPSSPPRKTDTRSISLLDVPLLRVRGLLLPFMDCTRTIHSKLSSVFQLLMKMGGFSNQNQRENMISFDPSPTRSLTLILIIPTRRIYESSITRRNLHSRARLQFLCFGIRLKTRLSATVLWVWRK